ncbi:MAG TPA: hypothetical protein VGC42_26435 [Kofleriaceae bacterium]
MKPILFIAFLALGPAIGAQVTPTVAMPEAAHVVVGDVEQLPDRDPVSESGAGSLRGHDPIAQNATRHSVEAQN